MNKQIDLSVIIPCYNEAGNISELVSRLQLVFQRRKINGEIVFINDHSNDQTGALIDGFAASDPSIIACHHFTNRGIEAGWTTGLTASHGTFVCLMDGDLQNMPEDVWRLYREILTYRTDIVQGYRSSIGRVRNSRYFLSVGLNLLLNVLFGMNARDNKSGFVLCHREALEEILRHKFHYHHFQTFITVAAKHKGFAIREIETLFQSRLVGKSFMPSFPVKVILQALGDALKALFEYRILQCHQSVLAEYLASKPVHPKQQTMKGIRRLWFDLYARTMPIHGWLISSAVKTYYDELNRSQWLSPEQITELQQKKLQRLIHQAYYHVSYYRELFDELGLKPTDIRRIEDLQKLPLLNKKTIRERLHFDLLSDNHDKRKVLRISTSGSTGEPFVCYVDKFQLEMRWAATLRSQEWTGYRFGDRCARLWHQTIGMDRSQIVREKIDAWMTRRIFVPAFEMSDDNLNRYINKIRAYRPILIDGYAESFNFLAHYVKRKGFKGFHPQGIISSAQVLPEESRAIIEEEFQCGVFDKYGSREFSGIAYESDGHDGHLVVAENYIVEILKDGRPALPGELGEVIITDLNNFCMPFIRYRVGDLAVAMDNSIPSPCGRGLPRIGRIEGRAQAIVKGSNGKYIPGSLFGHLLKDYDHIISQYQIVQTELGAITFKIVKAPRYTEEGCTEIIRQLRHFLGDDMRIKTELVDLIPLGRTGKRQSVISHLGLDFQTIGTEVHSPKLERAEKR